MEQLSLEEQEHLVEHGVLNILLLLELVECQRSLAGKCYLCESALRKLDSEAFRQLGG